MTIEITSRHFSPSSRLQQMVHEKVSKISKFSNLIRCQVILEKDHLNEIVEIKAHASGREFFAQESSELFEKSLTNSIDKIIVQIKKHEGKRRNHTDRLAG